MDIRVTWNAETMSGDWLLSGAGLDVTHQIPTAVAVALFTDRLAEADDPLPVEGGARRGWWGDTDAAAIHGGWPIGSRLWLIVREKQTEATRRRAEDYIREAMDPLVEIGLLTSYDLVVGWFAFERLGAEITCRGTWGSIAVRFEDLWAEMARERMPDPPPPPPPPGGVFGGEFGAEFG